MNQKTDTEFAAQRSHEPPADRRELNLRRDMLDYCREYARQRPGVVAMWCFGLGFVIGWKLKPW